MEPTPEPKPTPSAPPRKPRTLYKFKVTNLSEDTTRDDVFHAFRDLPWEEETDDHKTIYHHGSQPLRVSVPYYQDGKNKGKSKGFAIVTYGNITSAQKAVNRMDRYRHDCMIWSIVPTIEQVEEKEAE